MIFRLSVRHGFASKLVIPEDNAALGNEITRLAGHINAAQHRFLTLLAALIERDAWEGDGIKSPAHWLNYYCGIDLGAAREKVRVAKCLRDLPGINEAFRSGVISYSKVRAMSRSATPQNEAMLLQVALHGTAQHVEQLVRKSELSEESDQKTFPQKRADASMVIVQEDSRGNVLNVGRKTRTVPPSIRRALQVRDGGCRFPGCCESRYMNAHHVQHWCDGGETKLDNLVLLCRHHHRLLHQEGYDLAVGAMLSERGDLPGDNAMNRM